MLTLRYYLFDATYKLLELQFPLYIIIIEDGSGQSETAAAFLLLEETETSLSNHKKTIRPGQLPEL